jgi:predicted RNase H-related nuclease YkuK (DUF458 family)
MEKKKQWQRLDGTTVIGSLQTELAAAIIREKNTGHSLKVSIGTGSQVKTNEKAPDIGNKHAEFATAIVFTRKGKGGFMYIAKQTIARKMSIRERMLLEVAESISVAHDLFGLFTSHDVEMEIHVDINTDPGFRSNDALKEAAGYIMGMGFVFKAKPYAFASSNCANRAVQ